jgi:lipopolysaccharide export system permease protein
MIIDRYVLREIGMPFLGIGGVLLAVFVTFTLGRLLSEVGSGLLVAGEVRDLVLLKSLIALEVLLPIALYVAVLVGLGRLHRDLESQAFAAGGIDPMRVLRPVLWFALALALAVCALSTLARPWAWERIYTLKNEAEASSDIDRIKAGEFHEYGSNKRTVFIDAISGTRDDLHGVFVQERDEHALEIITAPSARFTSYVSPDSHELLLRNAEIFRTVDDGADLSGRFATFRILLRATKKQKPLFKEKAKSTALLYRTVDPSGRAEFQWRLSTPLSTLLLALAAVPLSEAAPRQRKHKRLLIALLIYAFYYNVLGLARNWVEQNEIGSLWWAPLLLLCAVIALYCYPALQRRYRARTASA